jgi:hypothetical protein
MASSGFYGNSVFEPGVIINSMMHQDALWQAQQYYPPIYQGYQQGVQSNNFWYAPSTTLAHYCKAIPAHLENYYQQLLNYHKQAGYKPKECEMLCCSLKRLGIKY